MKCLGLLTFSVFALSIVIIYAPQDNAQVGSGFVQGTLTDEKGAPAADVRINFYDADTNYASSYNTTTTYNGTYSKLLPSGNWKLEFDPFGTYYETEWYEDKTDRDSADPVTVLSTQYLTVDATLRSIGEISGAIYDNAGPSLGTCVDLYEYIGPNPGQDISQYYLDTQQVDSSGKYKFIELRADEYALLYRDCNSEDNNIKTEWHKAAGSTNTSDPIELKAGSMQKRYLFYRVTLQNLIFGRVIDSDSQPLEGICVELALNNNIPAAWGNYYRLEHTDAEGLFKFTNLDKTTYYWRVYDCDPSSSQYFAGDINYKPIFTNGTRHDAGDEVLVRRSTISGRVTDSQGQPIAGIWVKAQAGSGWGSRTGGDQTDINGEYTMDVRDYYFPYTITFGCGNLYCTYDEYQYPNTVAVTSDNTHITDINAQLVKKTSIKGTIYGVPSGFYRYGFTIELFKDGVNIKTVDSSSNFDFSSLQPGDYTLHFVDNGYCSYYSWWWPYECLSLLRQPDTYQDHWYNKQKTQDRATVITLEEGDNEFLDITMLLWGEYFTIPVNIDIKPDSLTNTLNCTNLTGVLPVALLSTDEFDAITVDMSTIAFGPNEAGLAHKSAHFEDVNDDGLVDMMMHFRLSDTGLDCGDEEVVFTADTLDNQTLEGIDNIYLFEPHKLVNAPTF